MTTMLSRYVACLSEEKLNELDRALGVAIGLE
jgi:hypothetical protein